MYLTIYFIGYFVALFLLIKTKIELSEILFLDELIAYIFTAGLSWIVPIVYILVEFYEWFADVNCIVVYKKEGK